MTLVRCDGVAVVLPVRDRPAALDRALSALARTLRPQDAVLVVDSASRSPAVARTAEAHGVAYLRVDEPGASRARNAGWRAVTAPVVAFTDDDCRPEPGWTEAYDAAFTDPDLGFAFGRVEPADGPGVPVSVLVDREPREVRAGVAPDRLGHGANLAFRPEVLARVGGFDEVLGAGAPLRAAEDKDLLLRCLDAGTSGRYVPDAVVVHDRRPTRWAAVRAAYAYGIGEGALAAKLRRSTDAPGDASSPARAAGRQLRGDLRARYWTGVALSAARAAGAVLGGRRARAWRIDDGRFVA